MIGQTSLANEPVSSVRSAKPLPAAALELERDGAGVPLVLDPEDAADIRDYCKGDGHYMPDHSTFAAALHRAELRSMGCTGCRRCGGDKVRSGKGFIPREIAAQEEALAKEASQPTRPKRKLLKGGKLAKQRKPKRKLFKRVYGKALREYRKREAKRYGWMVAATVMQRDALRARGNQAYTRKEVESFFPELPDLLLRLCPACKGDGTIPRLSKERKRKDAITARPTGSSKKPAEGGGAELNEESLLRRGKTDRRLAEVGKRLATDPEAQRLLSDAQLGDFVDTAVLGHEARAGVLETYFAPGAETLQSLWRFTRYGRILLDGPNPNELSDRERIKNICDAAHVSNDKTRLGYIAQADRQAQEVLDLAVRLWNTVIAELVEVSSRDRSGARIRAAARVAIADGGPRQTGVVIGQHREHWIVQGLGSGASVGLGYTRRIYGWHLEVLA